MFSFYYIHAMKARRMETMKPSKRKKMLCKLSIETKSGCDTFIMWDVARYYIERNLGVIASKKNGSYVTGHMMGIDKELTGDDGVFAHSIICISLRPVSSYRLLMFVPSSCHKEHELWLQKQAQITAERIKKLNRQQKTSQVVSWSLFCAEGYRYRLDGSIGTRGDYGHPSDYAEIPPKWLKCSQCDANTHYEHVCVAPANVLVEHTTNENTSSKRKLSIHSSDIVLPSKRKKIAGIPLSSLIKVDGDDKVLATMYDDNGNLYRPKHDPRVLS
jgi:hypothetical protein